MVAPKQGPWSSQEGGVAEHATIPLSKTEINLHRLLRSCERQAAELDAAILQQDLRFANYVAVSRELLNELQGKGIQNSLSSITNAKAQQYDERIASLEKLVDDQTRHVTTSLLNPSVSQNNRRSLPTETGHGSPTNGSSPSPPSPPSGAELRRRTGRNQAWTLKQQAMGAKPGGKLSQDVSQVLEQHRQLQEGLTDEMVELARAIKDNSLAMEQSMKETGKVLDATERVVEQNVATTSHVNTRASKIYAATFKTGCFTWLVLLAVSAIFFGMVFLIRIT